MLVGEQLLTCGLQCVLTFGSFISLPILGADLTLLGPVLILLAVLGMLVPSREAACCPLWMWSVFILLPHALVLIIANHQ